MIKQTIVDETIAAANLLLANLQQGENADATSLNRWSEALIRYVFYRDKERTHAQDIENMVHEIVKLDFSVSADIDRAIELLPLIVADVEEEAVLENLHAKIEWEPVFDRGMSHQQ